MNETTKRLTREDTIPEIASPSSWSLAWKRFRRHKLAILGSSVIGLLIVSALLAPYLTPYDINDYNVFIKFGPPSLSVPDDPARVGPCIKEIVFWECGKHPLGTDELGRDVLSRAFHGGQVSLFVGFVAALATTLLGSLMENSPPITADGSMR